MWSRPWHVMTCEITAPSRESFLWMQMADPPAFQIISLKKLCVFYSVFRHFPFFVLFLEYLFFLCFSPSSVFFECIFFWRFSWIWLTFLCLFFFSPFYILSFLFKKPRFCCLLFARKTRVSSFFLFFFAKKSELRDKNLISLEEFFHPVNFLLEGKWLFSASRVKEMCFCSLDNCEDVGDPN